MAGLPQLDRLYAEIAAKLLGQGVLGKPERLTSLQPIHPRIVDDTSGLVLVNELFTKHHKDLTEDPVLKPLGTALCLYVVADGIFLDPVQGMLNAMNPKLVAEIRCLSLAQYSLTAPITALLSGRTYRSPGGVVS
ncbi:hypothetical protein EUX98_g7086 [Antrodiella citrinella]|uniref:Uncharacterized protein n=1 Tax=Antrodiella citrinella TaxID=2447956 RepID=A0A4S4MUU3_9APHY|nr:hypothetical protein EUX98_g7086 [Antrodiella citrinella]